jgi:hypothetical protein
LETLLDNALNCGYLSTKFCISDGEKKDEEDKECKEDEDEDKDEKARKNNSVSQ